MDKRISMLKIFFRYDDYSSLSHSVVDAGLIDIFRRAGATCTFAVVPAMTSVYPAVEGEGDDMPIPPEKAAELRAAVECGAVDVALHGWNHVANAHTGHPTPSEFKGLGVAAQQDILRRGRDFLRRATGVEPCIFVPPWNSYDANTLIALESVGFLGVSANRYAPLPSVKTQLRFAPMTIELGGLRQTVERARREQVESAVIGVMLHPYDFHESADSRSCISLAGFEKELVWLLAQPDVQVVSIGALLTGSKDMDASRFAANHPSCLENVYPAFVPRLYSDPLYRPAGSARLRKLGRDGQWLLVMLSLLSGGVIAGLVARWGLSGMPVLLTQAMLVAVALAAVALGGRALMARAIYARAASLLAVLFGISIGLVW
jgi:peptidoglycan/xylan/chitin deacetylase (PgdA/CDA1 family)